MKLKEQRRTDLLSIGDANVYFVAKVSNLPLPGSEAMTTNFKMEPGGSAANVAVAYAGLGLRARLVARVRHDSNRVAILQGLEKKGRED